MHKNMRRSLMMICQKAKECKEICSHKIPHERNEACFKKCMVEGKEEAKCIEYKEEPVIQKLEELADQTAKKDAGKLRYDLIPGELIVETMWTETFCDIYPGTLTSQALDRILSDCITILGSWDNFLRELAKVYTYGCQKYSERSWQTVPNGRTRYEAGMFRHIDAFKKGEYVNLEDGGCLHVAQIAWNAIAIKWLITNEK